MATEELIDLTHENIISDESDVGKVKLNIGQRRMRAIYWRQDNDGNWKQTAPLPADPMSRFQYFAKGFRAKPPVGNDSPPLATGREFKCSVCGFGAKSEFGLKVHQKRHRRE